MLYLWFKNLLQVFKSETVFTRNVMTSVCEQQNANYGMQFSYQLLTTFSKTTLTGISLSHLADVELKCLGVIVFA